MAHGAATEVDLGGIRLAGAQPVLFDVVLDMEVDRPRPQQARGLDLVLLPEVEVARVDTETQAGAAEGRHQPHHVLGGVHEGASVLDDQGEPGPLEACQDAAQALAVALEPIFARVGVLGAIGEDEGRAEQDGVLDPGVEGRAGGRFGLGARGAEIGGDVVAGAGEPVAVHGPAQVAGWRRAQELGEEVEGFEAPAPDEREVAVEVEGLALPLRQRASGHQAGLCHQCHDRYPFRRLGKVVAWR